MSKNQATIDDVVAMIKQLVLQNTKEFGQIQNQLKSIKIDLQIQKISHSVIQKHLNKQEKILFNWKSNLFTKIDKSYTAPVKKHDEEIGALNNRTLELRNRIDKLEGVATI